VCQRIKSRSRLERAKGIEPHFASSLGVRSAPRRPKLRSPPKTGRQRSALSGHLTSISILCKRLRNRLLKSSRQQKSAPQTLSSPKATYDRDQSHDFTAQIPEVYCASERGVNRRIFVNQSGSRCGKHSLFLARAMAVVGRLRQLAD
jgi:hypothetical protein